VWHSQTPAWFFRGPDGGLPSRELALARMRKHIAAVVGHFKGKVKQWDVVNEAISDSPGEFRERMTPEQRAALDPYVAGLPDDVAQKQADLYRQAFEMFLRHRDVVGRVTFWGPQDGDSWLNNFPIRGRTDYPLLFDRKGQPKPAFLAVQEAAQAAR
jgi:GH35 family endo-1,4-beta-xylanase